ncbi:MAG TPA: hypothetical protein VNL37_06985, partial [Candidatus Polarisedimenticolia bacterium]|nr:hypothetical protein [Candidatus Polarisedimenticolia bacterium]
MRKPVPTNGDQGGMGPKNLQPDPPEGRGNRPGSPLVALARQPSATLERCELTHLPRTPIDSARAARQHADYLDALRRLGAEVRLLEADPAL